MAKNENGKSVFSRFQKLYSPTAPCEKEWSSYPSLIILAFIQVFILLLKYRMWILLTYCLLLPWQSGGHRTAGTLVTLVGLRLVSSRVTRWRHMVKGLGRYIGLLLSLIQLLLKRRKGRFSHSAPRVLPFEAVAECRRVSSSSRC